MATVDTLITQRDAYAEQVAAQGESFLNQIASIANGLTINVPAIPAPYVEYADTGDILGQLTSTKPLRPNFDAPNFPDVPAVPTIDVPDSNAAINAPQFTGSAPTLTLPDRPTLDAQTLPTPPTIESVTLPVRPSYSVPIAPIVTSLALPLTPNVDIPVFTAVAPTITLDPPSFSFAFAEEAYSSALLDPLKSKLLNYLMNGGFGMNETDEQRLFDRTRDRAQKTGAANMERIRGEIAASGFDFPPGVLIAAQQQSIEEMNNTIAEANREITLRRSELYVENERFTIGEVRALETTLMQFHAARMERALNAAKAIADIGQAIFQSQVARFNATWEAYRTAGQFFEIRVRAEIAKLDVYKTQMDGKRLEVEIQGKQVDVYEAQLRGIQTIQSIYKTDIEASLTVEQVNRTRLEAFKTQIDAYVASTRVKELEFQAYRAGIEGETARVNAFRAEVDAYDSTVRAEKARADVAIAVSEQANRRAQIQLEAYRAEIAGFEASMRRSIEQARVIRDTYGIEISAFKATADAAAESLRILLARVQTNTQNNATATSERINIAKLNVDAFVKQVEMQKSASQFGAQFYADRIAAVQNTLQALISSTTSA